VPKVNFDTIFKPTKPGHKTRFATAYILYIHFISSQH